jgi:hypothetical protein
MRKIGSLLTVFSTLLVASFGCSEEEGSTVSNQPNVSGTKSTGGGSDGSGGNPVLPVAGSPSDSAGRGGSLGIPTDACRGLPIDVSDDPVAGGAPSDAETSAAGAAGAASGACLGVSVEAEAVPVDLFIIMDRSQSMGFAVEGSTTTRWEALRDAVESFALDPGVADVRAGIGFFSISGVGDDAVDCDAASYAQPVVPIGLLPEVGGDLVAAMDDTVPAGLTPTVPALEGAISYAQSWAADNPERAALVVLVSDGYPTQCETGPEGVAAAAQAGYESDQHIRTFVIGVGDVAKFNLDNYARAGGTTKAFVTDAGDVTQSFVEALNNISNRELACEYQIPTPPEGMKLDTEKVQVIYTPASGSAEEVPNIPSLAACADSSNGGWYYDDPGNPSKITVCPCSCARFQAGQVDVRLGCKPRLGIR